MALDRTGMTIAGFPWRSWGVLSALGAVALSLSLPWPPPPLPLAVGVLALAAVVASGLWTARGAGFTAPLLEGKEAGSSRSALRSLAIGAAAGCALGGATLLLLRGSVAPAASAIGARLVEESRTPPWKRWIVSFDAAVLEEIAFRLLVVSLIAWLLGRRWLPSRGWTPAARAWLSVAIVALGFGLAHLPKWLATVPASPALVASVVALNGIGGLILGALYLRHGIEAAILGHLAADVVLHVLGPSLSWSA